MVSPVKFIYFDVGEVLVKGISSKSLADSLGVDYKVFKKVYNKYSQDLYKGRITDEELVDIFKKEIPGVQIASADSFWTNWLKSLSAIGETHDLIYQLATNYKIGILTNSHKGLLEQIKKRNLIPNIEFASIVESAEVGWAKPEKEIYLLAQKRSGFLPENIFFIDNQKENISAAKKLGWQGFIFDQENKKKSTEELRKILL